MFCPPYLHTRSVCGQNIRNTSEYTVAQHNTTTNYDLSVKTHLLTLL